MSELAWLDQELIFPPPSEALSEPNGLLCVGGDLSPERLILAYRTGIFPWFSDEQPILWWSPDPRCILTWENLRISRSMRRTINSGSFKISFDQAFDRVIQACADPREYSDDTWITTDMQMAYKHLHLLGYAHSIEVWCGEEELVGGLYGIALGRCFFGESMFSKQTNASKFAFIAIAKHLQHWGYNLFDCQVPNPHLESLGATALPRKDFLSILAENIDQKLDHSWQMIPGLVESK